MPTCSIEGVHPPILSLIGGIEVAETVKLILGKKPSLSERILHIDLEDLDFSFTKTFRADECPVCGSGKAEEAPKEELVIEELCGRDRGRRTFSLTPTRTFDLDVERVSRIATERGFRIENQGNMGLSMRTDDCSVNFLKRGSAVVVGPKDEDEAVRLYRDLLGKPALAQR